MKIYIAGKITGNDRYRRQFLNAEIDLCIEDISRTILNPADTVARICGLEHHEYIHICKAMIDVCDTVAFLPNWKESKGAVKEHEYAQKMGKKIIYLEG